VLGDVLEARRLLSTYVVDNTADSGAGTLRAAILAANSDANPGTDNIEFDIPASTAADFSVPVPGFDPGSQDWTITLASPLPTITRSVSIDGYSQGHFGVPFLYPSNISSAVQSLGVVATGGTFTLTTSAPLPVGTTQPIAYDATAAQVQAALGAIIGSGNLAVTGGPVNIGVLITFQGAFGQLAIPNLIGTSNLTGTPPFINISTTTIGGVSSPPTLITSAPNTTAALDGNSAQVRVIIDGSNIAPGAGDTGFVLDASDCILRGLAIDGFGVGVSVPNPTNVGDLIQGNFIGDYAVYPVDPQTGTPIPNLPVEIVGTGNTAQGVVLGSANATVGGIDPQASNVISGNGAQGVWIEPGASGNDVLNNQIGVIGPIDGFYYQIGNGAEGVLIESSGTASDPSSIVYTSSNTIGGAVAGSGNVISANQSFGVHLVGVGATRNLVEANYIGTAPGGGYRFGTGDPGNQADGVRIDDAPDNQIGGPAAGDGNVISSNSGAGVNITGADATGNTVANNIIGLTSDASAVLGNDQAGVADTSPGTVIGPGNVISANLIGVLISGSGASGVMVTGNLIGTDSTGEADLGNAEQGVEIDNASGATVSGNGLGSQVISGNQVGVEIDGSTSTQNLIEGNFIGVDRADTADRGNSDEGILIEGAFSNTVGGTTAAAANVISANQWGIRLDGPTATGNLIEGNDIGTDTSGTLSLGNEINGIIFTTNASNNTVGGTGGGQGNTIAFNVAAGVSVQSGAGNTIQSNSIFSNGHLGIELLGTANHSQTAPSISGASGGGTGSNIQGSLTSVANTSFLIQFFSNIAPDPSGFGQGQTFLGSTTVMTDASGSAAINFNLSNGLAVGTWVTATATNQSTGDTSAFSNAVSAQPVSVSFSMADYPVSSTAGSVTIDVVRAGNLSVSVSVIYATSNGSAIAGQDYSPVSGTLFFPPNQTDETFTVPILSNPGRSTASSFFNLTLSQPVGGATLGSISSATVTIANQSNPSFKSFLVVNTLDSGPGSLRQAIIDANADSSPGTDNIAFDIPASTSPNLDIPVPGFDPSTQTWTITLDSALPTITHSVRIDGYGQANVGVPFRYPTDFSSQSDALSVDITVTAGTYKLMVAPYTDRMGSTQGGTTGAIPYNATAAFIQNQLENLVGSGNVTVFGQTQPTGPGLYTITFQGESTGLAINVQIVSANLTGSNPVATLGVLTQGGVPNANPFEVTTTPNSTASRDGNNAHVGVIIDGTATGGGTGFVIDASNSFLRGLAIEGFGIGVSVPNPTDVGDLIQGNFIGNYLSYPVDPLTGIAVPAPNNVVLVRLGNTQQGVVLGSRNATLGGTDPQAANVIGGNGQQGVLIEPGATGNQVLGNQIGVVGPSTSGFYFHAGNGAEGVLIMSSGTLSNPSSIVYSSSNIIGGAAAGAGNIISANSSYGVHIVGVGATRNLVEANYIGVAPGGGFLFGSGDPGNAADGVRIDDGQYNQIGGGSTSVGNVIASNSGAGVNITGADGLGNTVLNNTIGLTADGNAALGNNQAGVADTGPGTVIGPGNVISANLIGVLISGSAATGVMVTGNLIGTDSTGEADLGNSQAGVDIESASGATISGNAQGSQVISGNLVGVMINGSSSIGNLVQGNFIGTDKAGTADRGNSNEGVLIEGGAGNTVGGTTAAARNVISANQWGVRIDGSSAMGNLVEGNNIGTDVSGTLPLGNEIYGVTLSSGASNNSVGGTATGQANTIAFNVAAGVDVDSGTGNSILTNSIFSNTRLGILLNAATNANDSITPPSLLSASPNSTTQTTVVQGTYMSLPNATFLIQFFSNLAADASGQYEGQMFLGSTIVTTSATGSASFSVRLAISVPASSFITATATSLSTIVPGLTAGDTSEFSTAVLSKAVSVQFATANYTVNSSAGVATINVLRTGNTTTTVSVNYATSNGTATAGVNYVAASGTLTFQPGQTLQRFAVTILPNTSQASGSKTVNLTLSQPMGGAALGSISTATLTIVLVPGPPSPPLNPTNSPQVTSEQIIVNGRAITAIALTFSQTLDAARADYLGNYGYFAFTGGPRSAPPTSLISLRSAVYNASTNTVTLTPSSPLPLNDFWQITVNSNASPLLNNGLTNLAGTQLLGSSGAPGTPYFVTFAAGSKLAYTDSSGNAVSLQLKKGGLMEMFRAPSGAVQELELVGTIAGKSALSGSVRRVAGSSGRTLLPPISGAAGVRIQLKTPPFYFGPGAPLDALVKTESATAAKPKARFTGHPAMRIGRP